MTEAMYDLNELTNTTLEEAHEPFVMEPNEKHLREIDSRLQEIGWKTFRAYGPCGTRGEPPKSYVVYSQRFGTDDPDIIVKRLCARFDEYPKDKIEIALYEAYLYKILCIGNNGQQRDTGYMTYLQWALVK